MVLEKYKHTSQHTTVIIGILVLSTKLCQIDGDFSIDEEEFILKNIPHNENQRKSLISIMEEAKKDNTEPEEHARQIYKKIGDHTEFLNFIIVFLLKLAHEDRICDLSEKQFIKKINQIFKTKINLDDHETFFIKFQNLVNRVIKKLLFKIGATNA